MNKKYSVFGSYEMGIAIVGGFTAAFAIVLFTRMFSPVICERAASKLQSQFMIICNEAVLDYIESENIDYTDIINIERSQSGEIQAMNTNMAAVNRLKSEIAVCIQKQIDKIEDVSVKFPSNGFFGFGGGINIPVKLISVGTLETDLNSSFEAAGINQTRIYITITVKTGGKLLLAGEGRSVTVKTQVPVAQTVIVGDVPSAYLDVKKQ